LLDQAQFSSLSVAGQFAHNAGSFGNHDDQATFNQDFVGQVSVVGDAITLFGNAWKAFELSSQYTVTKLTHIQFSYKHVNEAEGHAVCIEEDLNEDPFQGTHVRCIMLAGKQFTTWKHVVRRNLALGQPAIQSALNENAALAVDGNKNTYTDTGHQNQPWWQVSIENTFVVTDIIINSRFDMYVDRLTDFTITISQNSNVLYQKRFQGDAVQVFHVKDIDIQESLIYNGSGRIYVRITLNKNNVPHMLGEVEIYGNPRANQWASFDVSIGDLFRTPESKIKYIAFIQDNDAEPLVGESIIKGIQLLEKTTLSTSLPLVSN
jgi:hypothetical protein